MAKIPTLKPHSCIYQPPKQEATAASCCWKPQRRRAKMLKAAASFADANTAGRDAAVVAVLPDKDHQSVIRLLHWTLFKFHLTSVSKGNTSLASDIHTTDKNPYIFWQFLEMTSIWCQYLQLDIWSACSACLAAAFSLSFSRHMEGPTKHQFQQETWKKNLRIFQWLTSRGLNISDFCQSISCKAAPLEWVCVWAAGGKTYCNMCPLKEKQRKDKTVSVSRHLDESRSFL